MKIKFLLSIIFIATLISCQEEIPCTPPGSDELIIVIQDSLGNNLIEQNHPDLILTLTDSLSSHLVPSTEFLDGSTTQKGWYFNVDKMISGYKYKLEYDSLDIDTISVDWVLSSTTCNGDEFYFRSIDAVQYNDSIFTMGGLHTVIKAN